LTVLFLFISKSLNQEYLSFLLTKTD